MKKEKKELEIWMEIGNNLTCLLAVIAFFIFIVLIIIFTK